MASQHKQAHDPWIERDVLFQMANVGSEVSRALKWQGRDREIARRAFERSLELFDRTAEDKKNVARLKEILRAREMWVDFFAFDNDYHSTRDQWERYFLAFAIASNRGK